MAHGFWQMEKKEVIIEGPLRIGGIRVYVAVEVWLRCINKKGRLACFGAKRPTHAVIVSDSEKKVFTMQGEEVTIEELTKDVADIEALLDSQCIT